jgi:uncharacterized protein (DUF2267 family)
MSRTGLDVFDTTLDKTNLWLKFIGERLGPDRQRAYNALRAVLHALRDRLTVDQACHLGAQLPMLIRGIYFEAYRPTGKPERLRTQEEFLEQVAEKLQNIRPIDPRDAAQAVFAAVGAFIDPAEAEQVRQALPDKIRAIWPEARAAGGQMAAD